ncbi:MAG: sulfur carrier protein ThiS [Calditerricola sp.]|nr:thiamine biosynthesis protein ThiS [Bacillota bacterium]MCG0313409.1 sulfur carrier protein ThiS [Calditerricola sp.]
MKLTINGEVHDVPDSVQTVADLLRHFGLEGKLVIVEQNRRVLDRDTYAEVPVREGDVLELVHFVGGG